MSLKPPTKKVLLKMSSDASNRNKKISGLLIDPESNSVREITLQYDNEGSLLDALYDALGCSTVDAASDCVAFVPSGAVDDLWYDDEGLFSDCEYAFQLPYCVPIIGRGLILSCDDKGYSQSHTLTKDDIECLKDNLIFHRRKVNPTK